MNWDDLRYLLAVARAGTLSSAAKSLGVNHSTVSRRLQTLEEETGVRLFDRLPSGYVATAAGQDVVAVAERVEGEVLSLDRQVLGQDARLSGPLRVTVVEMLTLWHVDAIKAFAIRYPNIELSISIDNQVRSLSRREADIAMRVTNAPPEHLVGRRLVRFEYALYGAQSIIDDIGPDKPLDAYPWMAWDERIGARVTEKWMRTHVPNASITCHVDSFSMMLTSTIAGMGISFLPCLCGDYEPTLRRLRDIEPEFGVDLWLLTHPDLRHTARVRAFIDHVGAAISRYRAAYAGEAPYPPRPHSSLQAERSNQPK